MQVSFAKEPYKRDDILQKRPVILRSLLIVATPYVSVDQRQAALPALHTATHCNKLQHTATHCNTLQHSATHYVPAMCLSISTKQHFQHYTRQHTATHCNTLQHSAAHYAPAVRLSISAKQNFQHYTRQHTTTLCTTLQHTATHYAPAVRLSLSAKKRFCGLAFCESFGTLRHRRRGCVQG